MLQDLWLLNNVIPEANLHLGGSGSGATQHTDTGITMTANRTTARRRQITMAAAFIAAITAAPGPTANAEPSDPNFGINAYFTCLQARNKLNGGSINQGDRFDCCINSGGSWSTVDYHTGGDCQWPDAPASRTNPVTPPSSAVKPPPGSTNIN